MSIIGIKSIMEFPPTHLSSDWFCCLQVQRLGLGGGAPGGGGRGPGAQRGARHRGVVLRLRLPGGERLQPPSERLPPGKGLPLWGGGARWVRGHASFREPLLLPYPNPTSLLP